MTAGASPVRSVSKAMTLLNCLADAGIPLSLSELSACTGWAKSTVHGLLSAMRAFGVIEQEARSGKYRLGIRLFELGGVVGNRFDIRSVARPHLQRISIRVGESASVAVLEGDAALVLDCVDAASALRVVTDVGARLPLHASALGKALLSLLDERECRSTLSRAGLPAYTPHTLTEPADVLADCERIRTVGYAVENGEMRVGMRAVAVPLYGERQQARYALGVTGMFRRVTDETFLLAGQLLLEAAEAIRAELR